MRSTFISSLLLLTTLFCSVSLKAQKGLKINFAQKQNALWTKYKYNNKPNDSLEAINVLNELVLKLHSEGFLLAQYSNFKTKDTFEADFRIGPQFEWLNLNLGNINEDLLRRTRVRPKEFLGRPINPERINKLEEGILSVAENRGFPFASIRYDSLSIQNNQFSANINLSLGPEINFDSVQVVNNRPLKSKFLSAYLGIRKGQPYDQSVIDGVGRRLSRLSYVRVVDSPELLFSNDQGQLKVELEKRPVNTIDGVIGFLPNNSRQNGLLITGQFDLELHNPFLTGKYVGIHWRRLSEETQRIQMEYEHPNLFSSPINFNVDFNFLKQDTTFTRRDFTLDFSYNLGVNTRLTFVTQFRGTDLLAASRFQNVTSLPEIADYDLTGYGLNLDFNFLDDPILPNAGVAFNLTGSLGTKKIRPNSDLSSDLYLGIDLNSIQYQFDFIADYYWPVTQKFVLYTNLRSGLISNDRLFLNDAYRLGGLRSVRGFAESVLFATSYAYSNIEGRLFFDSQLYLNVFVDLATLEGDFTNNNISDNLLGVGLGINFTTSSGIFNFVYALGTSKQTGPINFNQSKIHFGYSTRF